MYAYLSCHVDVNNCYTMWDVNNCQQTTSNWCHLQKELKVGDGASQQTTHGSEGEEEDVSKKWDAQKQQQAIEVLLGSCAGSDFVQSADSPEVHSLAYAQWLALELSCQLYKLLQHCSFWLQLGYSQECLSLCL